MIQLGSVRLPKIGSIFRNSSGGGSFIVGPLIETDSGPYNTSTEFYKEYPIALGKSLEEGIEGQSEVLEAFSSLAEGFTAQERDDFGLVNYDLNPNNFLVDREFNVLAVIDWDYVVSAPDAALFRLPFLMGISGAVPGIVDEHPLVRKRQELCRQFVEVVEAVSQERRAIHGSGTNARFSLAFSKKGFFTKEAVALRSFTYVQMGQDFVNEEWLKGLRWLSEHSEAEVSEFYQHMSG